MNRVQTVRVIPVCHAAPDVPTVHGHRQVTDAHLLTLARRRGIHLVTFDAAIVTVGGGRDVELLTAL